MNHIIMYQIISVYVCMSCIVSYYASCEGELGAVNVWPLLTYSKLFAFSAGLVLNLVQLRVGGFVYSVITNLQGQTWVATWQVCISEENSHPD